VTCWSTIKEIGLFHHRTIRATTALAAAALLVLAACGSDKSADSTSTTALSSGTVKDGDTLHLAYLADMSLPDPDVFYDIEGNTVILSAYQGLLKYKADSTEFEPVLATSWDVSTDKLTYTFHLRSGVKFHDGTAFDSSAVKTSFQRRLDVGSAPSYMLAPVADMQTPDPMTFVVMLKQPVGPFLHYMASSWGPKIISPKALADNAGGDHAQGWAKEHADGTGPFQLTAFNRGQNYQLTRFDSYWGPRPHFGKVDIRIVPDMNTQILQLKSGDLDIILHSFPVAELGTAKADANLVVRDFPSYLQALLYVNTNKAPFNNQPTRQLLAGAVDRDDLVKQIYGAYAKPSASTYPPGILDASLAPVSYPPGSGKVADKSITFAYSADESGIQRRLAELIQQKLKAAGFTAAIKEVQLPQVYEYLNDLQGAPDLLLMTNTPDAAHPDTWARILWGSKGGLNFLGYNNPEVDKLLDEGAASTDEATAKQDYGKAGKLLADDNAIMFLADTRDVMVMRKDLAGVAHVPNYPWALDLGLIGKAG
jgi:peptide/nickel transport system substrate-binding protein